MVAILVATYVRKNGLSKQHLERCLNAIRNQTDQNFKLFLIGDKYENEEELFSFRDWLPEDKMKIINLEDGGYERSKWKGWDLWCNSPALATKRGIDIILNEGFDYICHKDDDDFYLPNHIEVINKAIKDNPNKNFIHTVCKLIRDNSEFNFPAINTENLYEEIIPKGETFAKCSVCVNYRNIQLRPRIVFEELGYHYVYDCDLWNRIGESGEIGVKVNVTTVANDDGYNIVRTEI